MESDGNSLACEKSVEMMQQPEGNESGKEKLASC
jgi:hypothetical protein